MPIPQAEGCGQLVSMSEQRSRVAVFLAASIPTALLVHGSVPSLEHLFYSRMILRLCKPGLGILVAVADVFIPSQLGPGFGHGLVVELEGCEVGLEGVGGGIKPLGCPHQFD